MKKLVLLLLCSALAGCGEARQDAPRSADGQGDELVTTAADPALCEPTWAVRAVGGSGSSVVRTGAFTMLDFGFAAGAAEGAQATCGEDFDFDEMFSLLDCVTQDQCGKPISVEELGPLLEPFRDGKAQVATLGEMEIEVHTESGGRTRVFFGREHDAKRVLEKFADAFPEPGQLPKARGGETIAGFPCCPGCTPCLAGQCEPRPGVIIRALFDVRYECACGLVCAALDELPEPCECATTCVDKGKCDKL
jgi:hypothetical protein